MLAGGEPVVGIDRIQPVLVGMQLALTQLWRSYGVAPDAVIGHSVGEVSAAVLAGALSPADGLRVIATRSRLMLRLPGQAATALPELRTVLADLAPQPPTIPVITGTGAAPVFDADYWAANLANPVGFSQAVAAAGADHGIFIEVSPHPLLTDAISGTLAQVHHHSVGTLARDTHDTLTFHTNLNATYTTQSPNTDHPAGPHPVIPTTPWHHTRHWLSPPAVLPRNGISVSGIPAGIPDDTDTSAWSPAQHWITIKERLESAVSAPRVGTLLGEHVGIATTPPVHFWQARLEPKAKPCSGFDRIRGVNVVPVSVLLQTLWTAAAQCGASALSDLRFDYPIVVDQPRIIQVVADGESVTVASGFESDMPTQRWIKHASARISHRLQEEPDDASNSGDQEKPGYGAVSVESVAALQQAWGIEGQPFEWSLDSCRSASGALHAEVDVPEASTVALLDVAVQLARLVDGSEPRLMLPAAAESVRFHAELADSHGAVEVHRRGGEGVDVIVDIVLTAPDGSTCVDIRSLRYAATESDVRQVAAHEESPTMAWSEMPAENILGELELRLRAILARELGMHSSALDVNRPFPELGLDSMMAMAVLREAKRLVGFDLSATMLWNNPTISSLAAYLTEMLVAQRVPQEDVQEGTVDEQLDSEGSVLDALFDSVESATAGSESGI